MGTVVSTGFVRGLMDKWPLADDSYWLGSSDKGWKGIYFADLKLYQYDATTLSIGTITGGSFLNITSDGTVCSLIPATGDYLRIGDAGTTSQSLAANDDLFVSGKLEVDGAAYMDSAVTLAAGLTVGTNVVMSSATAIYYFSNTDNGYAAFQVRDNSVGRVEVARAQGAADPFFQVGRDDSGCSSNSITPQFKLQGGCGATNEAAGFGVRFDWLLGNAASEVESRACIDAVLATATNGSEDVNFVFSLMDGGVAPAAVLTLYGADKSAALNAGHMTWAASEDSAAVADEVSIGGYDISAGHRAFSFSSEEVVVAGTTQTFSGYYPIRVNGATVRLALCTT